MARFARILLYILIALVVVVGIALFVITRVIDPNDFKPQITALAREHADLNLDIQGDLGWTLWPSLGVSIGRTEARIADDSELFAALDDAKLGVAILPLLRGRVEMDAITLSGVTIDLVEGANGGNWERIGASGDAAAATEAEPATEDSSSALDIPLTIPSVTLSDSRLRYRNTVDGTDITVEHLNVAAEDVSLDGAFPVTASLRYQDQADMRIDLDLATTVQLDLEAERYRASNLKLRTRVAGVTAKPLDVSVSGAVDADLGNDQVTVTDLVLEALGTRTQGGITLTGLSDKMRFAGQLDTAPFDANKVLQALGEAPLDMARKDALSKVAFSGTLNGPANSLMLDPMTLTFDDSTVSGKAGVADLDSLALVFNLALDRIALDHYLPPTDDTSTDTAAADSDGSAAPLVLSEEPLLPLDDLRELNVDGTFTIGQATLDGLAFNDIHLGLSARDGLLRLTRADGRTLDGGFDAKAQLDARSANPTLQLDASVRNVQLQPLVKAALNRDLFTGVTNLSLSMSSRGNSEKALFENAKGKIDFGLLDGIVRGLNLHNELIGGLNDMLGKFQPLAALVPNLESGRLPRELSEDTKILDLRTVARLENTVAHLDSFAAKLDRGASIDGKGSLNLLSSDFDLNLSMKAPGLSSDPRIAERAWPLHCSGNLAGSPARWCLPRADAFQDAGKELVARLAQDKLGVDIPLDREQVQERLDEEKAHVQERLDEEKEKAEEQLRDKARGALEGLLRR